MTINTPTQFEALYPANSWEKEIEQLFSHIKAGRSAELIGLPGSGKHNLLRLLSYNREVRIKHAGENQKWFHFVYMDFSEMKKRNLMDVTKFILISLSYSLSERGLTQEYEKLNAFLKEAVDMHDELILFQALKKSIDFLSIEKELTVILLFDKFEEYLTDVTEQFFTNLHILRDRAKYRFSAIFSVRHPLEEMLEASIISDFSEHLTHNEVYVSLFDEPSLSFRIAYLEKVTEKKLPKEIKDEVIRLAGGLGKLSYVSYENILSSAKTIPSTNLKQHLLNQPAVIKVLKELLQVFSPSEERLLLATTKGTHTTHEQTTFLENIGIIKNGKITIPLFEEYLKSQPVTSSEHITYNAEKNELYKGTDFLSGKLSASEFRLLKFLVLNAERILEKEEIITAVWKDSQTQEGVTDQALDQIIYRLRKKIEDDPNNPTHITTVKGRGFKFTS